MCCPCVHILQQLLGGLKLCGPPPSPLASRLTAPAEPLGAVKGLASGALPQTLPPFLLSSAASRAQHSIRHNRSTALYSNHSMQNRPAVARQEWQHHEKLLAAWWSQYIADCASVTLLKHVSAHGICSASDMQADISKTQADIPSSNLGNKPSCITTLQIVQGN